jgi:acyl-coenzyme A synthetase/AMP-(fatty) acid ligase
MECVVIVDRIYEWAQRQPQKKAIICNDFQVTYRQFSNAIQTTRTFLQRENLPAGQTAIVLVKNLLDAWVIVMALRALGLHTISVGSMAEAQSLKINDVACIVVTQSEPTAGNPVANTLIGVKVLAIPPSAEVINANELLVPRCDSGPVGGNILYTSGTTGDYKKLLISDERDDVRNAVRARFFSLNCNTVYHAVNFPVWTGIGFKMPSMTWHSGGCVVFDQRPEHFEHFFYHDVTFSIISPGMLKELVRARGAPVAPANAFALAIGGGSLPINIAEQTTQKLTNNLSSHFAATELNSIPLRSHFKTKDDLFWLTPTDQELVQIVDDEGNECSTDQEGEFRILLSDLDCHNYLDDEDASAGAFRDGFFYSGDQAVRRGDGRIRILGRTTDVLIIQGLKFAAAPMEEAIQRHLQVDEVCLFSGLNKQGYEEVVVAIQTDRSIPRSELESLASNFRRVKNVRFSIHTAFPRAQTGMRKTNRRELRRLVFEQSD